MRETLYVGIDVSKDKLDIALTQDGIKIISTATFSNTLTGFKKLYGLKSTQKSFLVFIFVLKQQEFITKK